MSNTADKIWFAFYESITRAMGSAGEITIPRSSKSNFTPVPGWKVLLEEPYDEARSAYLAWRSYDRPRSGPVHEWMKRTRTRFKYAPKVAKRNEETYNADVLAANCDTGNMEGFWKCITDYNTGQVAFSKTVHNAFDPCEIASVLTDCSTLSLTPTKKLKYCTIVDKISIPIKWLLQLLKYMRPYRSCLGTRHLDMMAWCQIIFSLHHIE